MRLLTNAAILAMIFVMAAPVHGFRADTDERPILPWDLVIQKEKPELPIAKVMFDSSHSFDALHYSIHMTYPFNSGTFSAYCEMRAVSNENNLSQVELDMVHLVADGVSGERWVDTLSFTRTDSTIIVNLAEPLQTGDTFTVRIRYHDTAQQRGMYYYPRNFYSMAEPYDARWWFPCYDKPWDKATGNVEFIVEDPDELSLQSRMASNGSFWGVYYSEIYTIYNWETDIPMSTYLFCVALLDSCAHWTVNIPDGTGDSIPCMYYVFREDSALAAYDFANVPHMMGAFNYYFGPYPFEKYGMVAVTPFAYGGMEHQTMTTINRSWINGTRANEFGIAHELAHQWWGDMVTMSDFRHIWLNEGFATYAEALFTEYFYGQNTYAPRIQWYQDYYFIYDEYYGRFPLFDPVAIFNAAEYFKGALVLHMLRGMMGDEAFFNGLRQYGQLYRYGNASTEDFRAVMEDVSGLSLFTFFHQWIYEPGYPEYRYAWSYSQSGIGYVINLNVAQVQQNAPIFTMPIQYRIHTATGDTTVTLLNSQQLQTYDIYVTGIPTAVDFDPNHWVVCKVQLVNSIDDFGRIPQEYSLLPNYPNPFNGGTVISFILPKDEQVKLAVYDINGRIVKTLVDGWVEKGGHSYRWEATLADGSPAAAGTYIYRLDAGGRKFAGKMTYLK
ncbi:MAG: T9SS type A sorting domain-containing protein [candidate division Zixibacteria bacterium]|nr:T9SS type A sorting domain-containing protein [candidate division Zixibacteria bacterium]